MFHKSVTRYPDNFDKISEKYFSEGFDVLSEVERLVFCVWWLEGEINNGGFDQYFWNSWSDHYLETLAALEKIGAFKTRELLQSASDLVFKGNPPRAQSARQEVLEKADENALNKLNELDEKFYKYEDNIEELVNRKRRCAPTAKKHYGRRRLNSAPLPHGSA